MPNAELITCPYAVQEARRNLRSRGQRIRLAWLIRRLLIVPDPVVEESTATLALPEKDLPIWLAAVAGKATHLVTGDRKHFGMYWGQTISGILIVPPADFLAEHRDQPEKG